MRIIWESKFFEFQHHGVKGQHWGKRNGPPYPLSGPNKERAKKSYKKPSKAEIKGGKTVVSSEEAERMRKESEAKTGRKSQVLVKNPKQRPKKKDYSKMDYGELEREYGKNDQAMMKRYHEYEQSDEVKKNFKKELSVLKKARRSHSYSDEMMEATRKIDNYIFSQSDMKEFMRIGQELDELMIKKGRY